MLAVLLVWLGLVAEAKALADEGVALAPSSPGAHLVLGDMFINADQAEQALAAFDVALRLDPNSARAHRGRGCALTELGRYREAVTALHRALELDSQIFQQTPEMKFYYQDSLAALQAEAVDPSAPLDHGPDS